MGDGLKRAFAAARATRQIECLLCNRTVGQHKRTRGPYSHKCPHGERCAQMYMIGYPDCDKCRAQRYQPFGDIAHELLKMQSQYASHYVDGRHGDPNCGEGLRFKGRPTDYHWLRLHPDDVGEFVRRVRKAREPTPSSER